MPDIPPQARAVLDVGCGAGQTLIANPFRPGTIAYGIDPAVPALALGKTLTNDVEFTAAIAEHLPFASETFDFVLSRVALPYTNIPAAVREMARVLRPGGEVWLTLHPVSMATHNLIQAVRALSARRVVYAMYVLANGFLLHVICRQLPFPIGVRRFESVQTNRGITKALEGAGFSDVRVQRSRFYVVTAVKRVAETRIDA
jgi:ubiquinone/menaquinone biosynthesis C-methylase UbiE